MLSSTVNAQPSDFDRLLTRAQALITRIRAATSAEDVSAALDELESVLDAIGRERIGLQEHVDEVVRTVRGLGERCR